MSIHQPPESGPARRVGSRAVSRGGYGPAPGSTPEREPSTGSLVDVVAMIPHRMGFHPRNSLVVVLLDAHGLWIATARHDVHPRVPRPELRAWLADVAMEAESVLLGVYGPGEVSKELAEDLVDAVPEVAALFVVHDHGWLAHFPGGAWEEHALEEVFLSPLQLEAQAAGSAPGVGAPRHELEEPDVELRERWDTACEARAAQLAGIELFDGLDEEAPEVQQRRALRQLAHLCSWGLTAWGRVFGSGMLRRGLEASTQTEIEDLVVAVHSLVLPGVRDIVLTTAACPEPGVEDSDVLLGHWSGPVDGGCLVQLEVLLERTALLVPVPVRAEALCVLAWLDWARGHGSVAGRTLDEVQRLVPGHRLAGLLKAYLDTGSVPRWLRPSHGGLGAR